ncbi:protein FAM204A-like [Anneissia japonica]|uniref:protein FAM204A-like n=1 Tax=Anneissia japonica TaxID=1529436 RepID=UPI001425737F|nr:protein FAM204A-like [Anneissia japonica]
MLSILPPGMSDSSDENLTDSSDNEDVSARPRHDDADEGNSLPLDGKSTKPPPRGVSQIQWEKFLELQKDREQIPSSSVDMVTRRNRKRRRQREKRCKNKEDSKIEGYGNSSAESNAGRKDAVSSASSPLIGPLLPGQHSEHPGQQKKWNEIKDYLWVHDRFKGVNYGKVSEMSGLEKEIESAITAKDFRTAEKLSDHLANRDFGAQIHDAIKAKEYVAKQEEEKMKKSQKKKKRKLAWRFEAKERWEMKGNM